jgi:hypothetical protein
MVVNGPYLSRSPVLLDTVHSKHREGGSKFNCKVKSFAHNLCSLKDNNENLWIA